MLTEKGLNSYKSIDGGCEVRAGSSTAAEGMFRPGWENDQNVKKFLSRNTLGSRAAAGPLLVISGEADPVVPSDLTAKGVARLCEQKDRVFFVKYPGSSASEVLGNSLSEQISWIRARFSGLPAPGNCP